MVVVLWMRVVLTVLVLAARKRMRGASLILHSTTSRSPFGANAGPLISEFVAMSATP
jgi:hypothetical protein